MTLPDQIKALPLGKPSSNVVCHYTADEMRALRDAAASLAAEHDARMQRMAEALKRLLAVQGAVGCTYWDAVEAAQDALREHKEQAR